MTLTLSLRPEVEAKLQERAAAEGTEISSYALKVLEQAVARPSLEEILSPLRREFAASGVSDEELVEQITEAREVYRKKH